MNLINGSTPADYVCCTCGAAGVKLWREYQTCAPRLLCLACAEKRANKPEAFDWSSDSIGWMVPAVPADNLVWVTRNKRRRHQRGGLRAITRARRSSRAWWGYSSVPTSGCRWWHLLEPRSGCRWWHLLEPRSTCQRHAAYQLDDAAWLVHLQEQVVSDLALRYPHIAELYRRDIEAEEARQKAA